MATNNPVLKTLALANSGKRYPVLQLVGDHPEQAALISKLISPPQTPTHNERGNREIATPNAFEMRATGLRTSRNISDAQTVMQLLPDIELSAQILVSSILSPKDMMTTELLFTGPDDLVSTQMSAEMLQAISKYFEHDYKIKNKLNDILRDILFEKGSHVLAVLPENSIDEVINRHTAVTMESVRDLVGTNGAIRPLGLLGNPNTKSGDESNGTSPTLALEDFKEYNFTSTNYQPVARGSNANGNMDIDLGFSVTDNPGILKYPKLVEKIRGQRIRSAVGGLGKLQTGLESRIDKSKKLSDRELSSALYKRGSNNAEQVTAMRTQDQLKRRTLGKPLIMELPSESVIPVHVPGQEEKHIGYFVILDMNGYPVKSSTQKDHYAELAQRMNPSSQGSYTSSLINRIQSQINGFDCANSEHLDYSSRVYADMVEQDLLARLKNGIYTNGVQLAKNEEVYRIMLARALAQKRTQLLFMPVELVTYFAFRYNGDGIGKSILDDQKILNSLRAMLMFSNTMASIRNSIGLTTVKLTLDEHDVDPQKTIERVLNEIIRAKAQAFPLGVNSPVDLTNWLQRSGYQFIFDGHPGIPNMSIEQTENNTNYVKPDPELEESLRKRSIMAAGLNPETVDQGFAGELATSVVASNILLSRRVMQLQEKFCPQLGDHLQKVVMATEGLLEELREIVAHGIDDLKLSKELVVSLVGDSPDQKNIMIDYLLSEFVRGLEVTLPRPNTVTMENQASALESFIKILDPMLDAFISDQFFTAETGGAASESVGPARNALRAYFIRRFAAENGILPELFEVTSEDDDGKPKVNIWDAQQLHIAALIKSMTKLMVGLQPLKDAAEKVMTERTDSGGEGAAFGGNPSGVDLGSGGGDGGFGGDDFVGADPTADPTDPTQTTEVTEETSTTTQTTDTTNLNGEEAPADPAAPV